ncbi:hypothetical protein DFH08DRAFT_820860 [Mycena albidolilacea]|uniref:Uncharacterized protein n=1 Tax=Mycena albidolilacea TaxID=1033008 RepID=A0AAD6ZCA5_9AGAR|nr:hypothetical protein DFH08DRAFT_820860 [Mycena albidolilacea]
MPKAGLADDTSMRECDGAYPYPRRKSDTATTPLLRLRFLPDTHVSFAPRLLPTLRTPGTFTLAVITARGTLTQRQRECCRRERDWAARSLALLSSVLLPSLPTTPARSSSVHTPPHFSPCLAVGGVRAAAEGALVANDAEDCEAKGWWGDVRAGERAVTGEASIGFAATMGFTNPLGDDSSQLSFRVIPVGDSWFWEVREHAARNGRQAEFSHTSLARQRICARRWGVACSRDYLHNV